MKQQTLDWHCNLQALDEHKDDGIFFIQLVEQEILKLLPTQWLLDVFGVLGLVNLYTTIFVVMH